MLKSFKSFKSFKGDSNVSSQIWCKSTAILLYRCEENIKKLLNRIFVASHSLSIDSAGSPITLACGVMGCLTNLIRVLLQKCTFINIPRLCTYPNSLGLKTKEKPKKNQGTTKELQNSKKYFY